ncbi:hypothetical protein BGW38_003213 [Lunasporangiospora selenospora]|uniref:Gfd2/YDR514C-like C-terminal domain-containing protein n=1 Tax=Lunasporangiospora selenospora TaxID=979761 RepID=A0A9P6KHT7_9FUNG|nr:hypothetical protein BGW38_003213 [Lunasporangiospora selenospora]
MPPKEYLQLHTVLYEWSKECPMDLKKDLSLFFNSQAFLDRKDTFFRGLHDRKWVALITKAGVDETRATLGDLFNYHFLDLYVTPLSLSQISAAPRMPSGAAYNKFIKDLTRDNKVIKAQARVVNWKRNLDRATDMVVNAPGVLQDASTSSSSGSGVSQPRWFISVDVESFERDHSKILEIGWSIWDSGSNLFVDKHYAVSDYRHLKNGRFVPDRRDRFMFGTTIWEPLEKCISAFQQDLDTATAQNMKGEYVLIAHDLASDETYLQKMGVQFPKNMVPFDTIELNCARIGDSNAKVGLGKLLDSLDIENYCLHNAGKVIFVLDIWLIVFSPLVALANG